MIPRSTKYWIYLTATNSFLLRMYTLYIPGYMCTLNHSEFAVSVVVVVAECIRDKWSLRQTLFVTALLVFVSSRRPTTTKMIMHRISTDHSAASPPHSGGDEMGAEETGLPWESHLISSLNQCVYNNTFNGFVVIKSQLAAAENRSTAIALLLSQIAYIVYRPHFTSQTQTLYYIGRSPSI